MRRARRGALGRLPCSLARALGSHRRVLTLWRHNMRLRAHLTLAAAVTASALPSTDRGIQSARLTQIQSGSLVGVWKPMGIDSVGEHKHETWVTIPVVGRTGPGLLVFTARHYSLLGVA